MFSRLLLVSLFVAAAVAAPVNKGATPSIIHLKSNVSCTNVNSPGVNPTPSPTIILLNAPSPQPSNSDPYVGYAAAPQPSGSPSIINLIPRDDTPPVINLNPPPVINLNPPPVINLNPPPFIELNRRQFASTGTFSFGGIVPSSTIPSLTPGTPTTTSSSSFSFGGIVTPSSPAPAFTATPSAPAVNGVSTFTSTGADGIRTVFLLSTATVTLTNSACSSSPAFNPALAPNFTPGQSSNTPPSTLLPTVSSPPASSTLLGVNAQGSATSSSIPVSNPSIINLNTPPTTPTPAIGFSFSSAPATSVTPAAFSA